MKKYYKIVSTRDSLVCTQIKAQPYPSERAAVEQEKMKNQLKVMSTKLNEVANKKEPVVAFRATSVKDSGDNAAQYVSKNPGKSIFYRSSYFEYHLKTF